MSESRDLFNTVTALIKFKIESNFIQRRSKGHNYFDIPVKTSSMQSILLPFHFE